MVNKITTVIHLPHLEKKGCNEEGFLESDMREKRTNMNQ